MPYLSLAGIIVVAYISFRIGREVERREHEYNNEGNKINL